MIVICPACGTRYRLGEGELPEPAGRLVRCANCRHSWRQTPEPLAIPPIEALRADPAIRPAPIEAPRADPVSRSAPAAAAERGRGGRGAFAGLVVIFLLVGAIAVALLARAPIMALWPAAARLYALAGWSKPVPGAGLEISKITPARTGSGLIIEGEVKNVSTTAHRVPRLRVALRNAAAKEVRFKLVAPPKPRLLPGEVEHFKTPFAHPPNAATGVVVTFAPS